MNTQRSGLRTVFSSLLYVVGLIGVLAQVSGFFATIQEFSHSEVSAKPRLTLTLLSQAFAEESSVGAQLALFLVFSFCFYVGLQWWSRRDDGSRRFFEIAMAPVGYWLVLVSIFTTVLWITDFRYIPSESEGASPHLFVSLILIPSSFMGGLALILYTQSRRTWVLLAYAGLPLVLATMAIYLGPLRRMRVEHALPDSSETMFYVPVVVALLVMACCLAIWFARKLNLEPMWFRFPILAVSTWSWALLFFACFSVLLPFHCMCLVEGYAPIQQTIAHWITVFFCGLWTIMLVGAWRSRSCYRKTATA